VRGSECDPQRWLPTTTTACGQPRP
jgi:hypothetical protein